MAVIIKARQFSLGFTTGQTVLANCNFDIHSGEIVGLTGPSGSGKTLLSWAMLGMLPSNSVTSGQLQFFNRAGEVVDLLNPLASKAVRGRLIAIVPQNPFTSLNPSIRCGRQVKETSGAPDQKVLDLLKDLGIGEPQRVFDSFPHELSGGQLQRVVVAMAAIAEPQVLIADEATTALDNSSQRETLDILKKWRGGSADRSVVIISHDRSVIDYTCDRVLEINEGQIESIAGSIKPGQDTDYRRTKGNSNDTGEPILNIHGVNKRFNVRKSDRYVDALSDVSLQVNQGDIFGIVGLSGSGKSTLAKVLNGLARMDSGRIELNGINLQYPTSPERRRSIQLIFQDPYSTLYPHKTVRYFIEEAILKHFEQSAAERDAVLMSLMDEVGLPTEYLEKYPGQLSGGERQRVQIARALGLKPSVLVCDECVTGLDKPIQSRILQLLVRLNQEKGMTILFISHDLDLVHQLCNKVAIIHEGQIAEVGDVADIFTHPSHPATNRLLNDRLP